jgi:hypothetical protein
LLHASTQYISNKHCVWPNMWNDTCPIVFGTFLLCHACEFRVWFQYLFHSLFNFKVSNLVVQPSLSNIITYFMQWTLKSAYKCNHCWCKKGIYFHNFCYLNQRTNKMTIHSLIVVTTNKHFIMAAKKFTWIKWSLYEHWIP